MDKQDRDVIHRLADLATQADRRNTVLFSDFLTLNERRLLREHESGIGGKIVLSGGHEAAERQVAAFLPDALSYEWTFPIVCISIVPVSARFAETLTHRDVLGSLMNLGIERKVLGDIVISPSSEIYVFCLEKIGEYLCSSLTKIKHTVVHSQIVQPGTLSIAPSYREMTGQIASNRLDAFVAMTCRMSRAQTASYILGEYVSINGKVVTNHNHPLSPGDIISLKGHGKLEFMEFCGETKKGRSRVKYRWYQ